MIRALCLAAALASGAGLAGSPAECAAQTGSQHLGMSLTAAIEEARRSPFHAGTGATAPRKTPAARMGVDGATAAHPYKPGPQEESADAPAIALTFASAVIGYGVGLYVFLGCLSDESAGRSSVGCYLGPLIPLPTVAAAVALGGVRLDTALGMSLLGWLGGGVAFVGAWAIAATAASDPHFAIAAATSSLVHAGIVTLVNRN